jgi:hypothetical protein
VAIVKPTWLILLAIAIGACIDERPYVPTFTEFVIELVNDHGEDQTPAAYDTFKELPDPDGDTNNTAAYDSLFH